jgi:prolyl oligopeptidase
VTRIDYPSAPVGDEAADPYRTLEQPDRPDVVSWIAAQNALTELTLSAVLSRGAIRRRLAKLWDYPNSSAPFQQGRRWFQFRNAGLQAQSALYVASSPTDQGRVLIDPNVMSADGTVSLTSLGVSFDGELVAYATSSAGSDFLTWRVRSVESGEDMADVLQWSRFCAAAWNSDGSGFFYEAVAAPEEGGELGETTQELRIMFHRLGTDQSADEHVFSSPDQPDWIPYAEVSEDGRYLIVTIERGSAPETQVLVKDLETGSEFVSLVEDFTAKALVIGNVGSTFYLITNREAERGQVVAVVLGSPDSPWRDVVTETDQTLIEAHLYGGRLVCHYLEHAHSALDIFSLEGLPLGGVPLPGFVALAGDAVLGRSVMGRADSSEIYFRVESFTESGALWSHDLESGSTILVSPSTSEVDPGAFVTEQVFVESDDGTRVPMFLTHRTDVTANNDIPVILYGYGGFDVSMTPWFSVEFAAFMERGGLLAVANLRGGGEYGRSWYEGGRFANKQNVFDDFCACARWLGGPSAWSRPGRIAIAGGSNGGLLVGACLTQQPALFGAALADVGVFDMLRFHLFTIGWAWKSDFGDPDVPSERKWIQAYSPLHHVRDGECYPPTLLLTGDHDDRVVPWHSYKFAATLQAAQKCDRPILLRVETSAGHGFGTPTAKLIAEATDRLSFLEMALN